MGLFKIYNYQGVEIFFICGIIGYAKLSPERDVLFF